ncbi:MAG: hypothetical protein V1898_00150 [Patescibacteria group bacterium]
MGKNSRERDKGKTKEPGKPASRFEKERRPWFECTHFSEKFIRDILTIAQRTDCLEEFAYAAFNNDPSVTKQDFYETIKAVGFFDSDFLTLIMRAAKELARTENQIWTESRIADMNTMDERSIQGMTTKKQFARTQTMQKRMVADHDKVKKSILKERRFLLLMLYQEIEFFAHQAELTGILSEDHSVPRILEMEKELNARAEAGNVEDEKLLKNFTWYKFALMHEKLKKFDAQGRDITPVTNEPSIDIDAFHSFFSNEYLETSNEPQGKYEIPGITIDGKPIYVVLHAPPDLHNMALCGFDIHSDHLNLDIVAGEISRVNPGAITVNHTFIMPIDAAFKFAGRKESYAVIQQAVLRAMINYHCTAIAYDQEDRQKLLELLQVRESSDEDDADDEERSSETPTEHASEPSGSEQVPAITAGLLPEPHADAGQGEKKSKRKKRHKRWRYNEIPKNMCNLKVRSIFLKLPGMQLTMERGKHPTLIGRNGKSIQIDNVHGSFNKRVMERNEILEKLIFLGYSEHNFLVALN